MGVEQGLYETFGRRGVEARRRTDHERLVVAVDGAVHLAEPLHDRCGGEGAEAARRRRRPGPAVGPVVRTGRGGEGADALAAQHLAGGDHQPREARPADDLDGLDAVAPEAGEALPGVDLGQAQDLGEQGAQSRFVGGHRGAFPARAATSEAGRMSVQFRST